MKIGTIQSINWLKSQKYKIFIQFEKRVKKNGLLIMISSTIAFAAKRQQCKHCDQAK